MTEETKTAMRLLGVERVEQLGLQHVSTHGHIHTWFIANLPRSTLAWLSNRFTTVHPDWDPCKGFGRSCNIIFVVVFFFGLEARYAGTYFNEYPILITLEYIYQPA